MGRNTVVNLANFPQFTAINVLSDPGAIGGPVIVPSCVQVVWVWTTSSGKGAHNVTYGRYGGAFTPSATIANALLAAIGNSLTTHTLLPAFSSTSSLAAIQLRDVNTANQPIIQSTGPAFVGTDTALSLPNEVAVTLTMRTALAGIQNRGRLYLPSLSSGNLAAGNVISAGIIANLTAFCGDLIGIYAAQGLTLSIGHKARAAYTGKTGTQHPARAATSVPVTSVTVRDNHWDTIRRRGLK